MICLGLTTGQESQLVLWSAAMPKIAAKIDFTPDYIAAVCDLPFRCRAGNRDQRRGRKWFRLEPGRYESARHRMDDRVCVTRRRRKADSNSWSHFEKSRPSQDAPQRY